MKISVCIPVYNVETYLDECLRSIDVSISGYAGAVDYEVILVDDSSTDGSGKIVDEYVKTHPTAQSSVHRKNKGLAEARNTLLSMASGDYIAWVDSDDTVSVDWFPTLAQILEKEQPDIVAFELQSFCGDTMGDISTFGIDSFGMMPNQVARVSAEEYACKVLQGLTILDYSPTRIIRRSLHHGLSYRAPRGVWEDTIFAFDALHRVRDVIYVCRPLYLYRQRGDSIMHTRKNEAWIREIQIMQETIGMMKSPFSDSATVHLMTAMRRVMLLAIKSPSDAVLRAKSKEFKRFYRRHLGLVLFGAYLPFRRRIADLVTMLPFSDVLLSKCSG